MVSAAVGGGFLLPKNETCLMQENGEMKASFMTHK